MANGLKVKLFQTLQEDLQAGRRPNLEPLAETLAGEAKPLDLSGLLQGQAQGPGLQASSAPNLQQMGGGQGLVAAPDAAMGMPMQAAQGAPGFNPMAALQGLQMMAQARGPGVQAPMPNAPMPQAPTFQAPSTSFTDMLYGRR